MAPLLLVSSLLLLVTISSQVTYDCVQFAGDVTVKKGNEKPKNFTIDKPKGGECSSDMSRAQISFDAGGSLTLVFEIADGAFTWRQIQYSEGSEIWFKDYMVDWKGIVGRSFQCAQNHSFQLGIYNESTTAAPTAGPATTAATTAGPATTAATTAGPETTAATTEVPETTAATTEVPETTAATTEVPETTAATTEVPETTAATTEGPAPPAVARSYGEGSTSSPQYIEITLSNLVVTIGDGKKAADDAATYCRSAPDVTWVLAGSAAVSAVLVLGLIGVALRVF